jgi:hypothetical protein
MSKKNGSGSGAKKNGSDEKKHDASSGLAGSSSAKPQPVKAAKTQPERWSEEPDEHDYPAAASFLSLICDPTEVRRLVTALKAAPIVHHQAKDLLRASGLGLLPTDNFHVASDLAKVAHGQRLSPVLLMRGDFRRGVPLTIADGYHRICASYHLDENADIPCHLVDHKGPTAVPGFRLGSAVDTGTGPDTGSGVGAAGAGADTGSGSATGSGSGTGTGSGTRGGSETPAGAGSGPVAGAGSPGGSEAPGGALPVQ